MKKTSLLCAVTGLSLLTACADFNLPFTDSRSDNAKEIAHAGGLTPMSFTAAPFVLAGWGRVENPGTPIDVYIEGDGLAWMSKSEPSLDPTPSKPLALDLAAEDPAPNVIYIARPCQFVAHDEPGNNCDVKYWTSQRFAPEVIDSMNNALDQLSTQYHPAGFHLIGYSGGGNVAALLAERRSDVISLRTIAGNIDNDSFTLLHGVSAMPDSLNAKNEAAKIANLPQIHFVGAQDTIVPASLAEGFKQAAGNSACIEIQTVQAATHETGWADAWPDLLQLPVTCTR